MNQLQNQDEFNRFVGRWPPAQAGLKGFFLALKEEASSLPGASPQFIVRPGVSHSLRFDLDPRPADRERPVFFLADVVPAGDEFFLSVCFYQDEIDDPRGLGNAIPQGLFQETGYCFDVEGEDADLLAYIRERIAQAFAEAGGRA